MLWARIRVDGRLAGGLQALLGAPMAVCDGRWGTREDRGHGKRRSRTGMARVGGDVQLAGWRVSGGRAPSGWEWNGSQSGQGVTDLLLPRPALGKMEGEPACRAGDTSGQGEDPPLGRSKPSEKLTRTEIAALDKVTAPPATPAKPPRKLVLVLGGG